MTTPYITTSGQLPSPCYVVEETLLRRNLALIRSIAQEAGVEFILAFKAFALWRTFPIFREYISHTTASSLYEARLAYEEFGSKAHTYSPAYEDGTFGEMARLSSHITFNSLSQLRRFAPRLAEMAEAERPEVGLRINPERSEIQTALYDPCAPGSRFGVLSSQLSRVGLPSCVDGLHCHCHCESSSYALENTLSAIEKKFGEWLPKVKWLNLGGGHLVTRKDYDVPHLIALLKAFRERHPNMKIILEPGSAFAWQTGTLRSRVVDVVENHGIRTAILNVSFTCHMPDCLEMPYHPAVRGAETIEEPHDGCELEPNVYRLGGNSCLSGDYMGYWRFPHALEVGDEVTFEDMIHYTTVKTNMFNGIHHPSIAMLHTDDTLEVLRDYGYEDYRDRMD